MAVWQLEFTQLYLSTWIIMAVRIYSIIPIYLQVSKTEGTTFSDPTDCIREN